MNKSVKVPNFGAVGAAPTKLGAHGKTSATLSSRLVGTIPWVMIAGLLYAGLFVHPQPKGGAVIPPTIERQDLLFGVTVTDKGNIWIDGNFGKIIRSNDDGKTWARQESGTDAHLQDIDSWDDQQAVAVGNGATVLRTQDGGATWSAVTVPHSDVADKLIRVRASAGGQAWAVGEYGTILHTTDFGATWQLMRKLEDVNLDDIDAFNPKNIWVAGESGRLFHSSDEGATWQIVQSEATSSLMAIQFRDSDKGVAVGLDGTILHTEDGGANWRRVPDAQSNNTQHLFAVTWDSKNNEWIAVGSKGVWVRMDGDLTHFTTGKLSSSDLSAHTKIGLIDQSQMVIAGERPGIWDRTHWTSLVGR